MPQLTSKIKLSIATNKNLCIYQAVLALITLLDGSNAAMFHVEHCGNRKWMYQCRWPQSSAPEYRDWGPLRKTTGDKALEPMMDPNVIVEVRWRWEDENPESRLQTPENPAPPSADSASSLDSGLWSLASPRQWGMTTCDFHVIVRAARDFRVDPLIHAVAMVRGVPVSFELVMPPRGVAGEGQEILTVSGTSLDFGPSTVLREAGEFTVSTPAFTISNAGPSQVTLLPVDPAPPRALPFRRGIAVKIGTLPPEEIELLREYAAGLES